ncbi:MAG: hypothetical protein LBS36_11535 [Oscillospiraceae bacterium]|jgi:hypothetical protein|nr:hypothetical protein [Oscillospiraceae bacterium]
MKKIIFSLLALLLIFSTACDISNFTKIISKDSVYVASPGDSKYAVTDNATAAIENYVTSHLSALYIIVKRQTDRNDKIKIGVWVKSVEIHDLGQYIFDAMTVCRDALQLEKEELLYVHIMVDYEQSKQIQWTSSSFEDGKINNNNFPEISTGDRTLEQVMQEFSPTNKELPDIKPDEPLDS